MAGFHGHQRPTRRDSGKSLMDETEFVLRPAAVRDSKIWGAEVSGLIGSEVCESVGMGNTPIGQFLELNRTIQ